MSQPGYWGAIKTQVQYYLRSDRLLLLAGFVICVISSSSSASISTSKHQGDATTCCELQRATIPELPSCFSDSNIIEHNVARFAIIR